MSQFWKSMLQQLNRQSQLSVRKNISFLSFIFIPKNLFDLTYGMTMDIDYEEDDVVIQGAPISSLPPPTPETPAKADDQDDGVVGLLEDQAKKRKERLRALKQKLVGGGAEENKKVEINKPLPKPVFRSYDPTDDKLVDGAVPKAKVIDIEEEIADTLEHSVVKPVIEDVDLTSLAPRKPDWDLKRDVAPKIARLERRTQKAIAELILERLKASGDNLAAAVEFSGDNVRVHDSGDEED